MPLCTGNAGMKTSLKKASFAPPIVLCARERSPTGSFYAAEQKFCPSGGRNRYGIQAQDPRAVAVLNKASAECRIGVAFIALAARQNPQTINKSVSTLNSK